MFVRLKLPVTRRNSTSQQRYGITARTDRDEVTAVQVVQETSQFTASQYLHLSSFSIVKLQQAITKKPI